MPNAQLVFDRTPDLANINRARRSAGLAPLPSDTELNVMVREWEQRQAADRKKQHDLKVAALTSVKQSR